MKIQWGTYYQTQNENYTVNLISYNNINSYSIFLTCGVNSSSSTMNYPLNYRPIDEKSFTITAGSSINNTYLNWFTIGY